MSAKRLIILLATVFLIGSAAIPMAGCAKPSLEVINLDSGKARGTLVDGIWSYLGIPYAAPPIGDLRWREPQPVKPWEGIRDCNEFGLACPQPKTILYDMGQTSEDCLYLNVWSPAKSPNDKLPVMVWIHGGGFTTGSGSLDMYNGTNLAKQNVIVVTINYRLGPFGFLSHPLLRQESQHGASGNYGLLDQIAALKWVQQNIKALGGNPDCVTIFGESAGGISVCDLMVSPLADGLFQRAISESGSFSDAYPVGGRGTVENADKTGQELAANLGCDKAKDVLAVMRQKTTDEVFKAAFADYDPTEAGGSTKFWPIVDGWVIPDNPWSPFTAEKQKKVPLLIGTNANEGSLFVVTDPKTSKMSQQDYAELLQTVYGDHASEVLAVFPVANTEDIPAVLIKLRTVMSFSAGALHAADTTAKNNSPVYMYQFTRVPDTPLKKYGAFHGLEIFYVFGNLHAGKVVVPDNKMDISLSQDIMKYWTNFAKSGDPNGPGLPKWPAYSSETGQYIDLGDQITAKTGLDKEYRDLIDKVTQK